MHLAQGVADGIQGSAVVSPRVGFVDVNARGASAINLWHMGSRKEVVRIITDCQGFPTDIQATHEENVGNLIGFRVYGSGE